MSIGNGIAIAGVWIFAGCCALGKKVSGSGFLLAIIIAIVVTFILK